MWIWNVNVTCVIIKQFNNKISTHINRVNMNESNIILTSVIKNNKGNVQTMVPNRLKLYLNVIVSWWFLLSLHFKKRTSFGRVLSPHRPWQECSNVNSVISDHEATQKYLLSTHSHKYVGTRFKCNQCDQLAIQWCNLKSHKQSKCIKYQCGLDGPGSPCGAPGTGGPGGPRLLSNLFHLRIWEFVATLSSSLSLFFNVHVRHC